MVRTPVRRLCGAVALAILLLGACSHPVPPPAPTTTATPAVSVLSKLHSVAAIGDSISQAVNACDTVGACPEASWATGSRSDVDSVARRLTATYGTGVQVFNDAKAGAKASGLGPQVQAAVAQKPALVTLLVGSNDICTSTLKSMTSTADFRTDVQSAVTALRTALPNTYLFVFSLPDIPGLKMAAQTSPAAANTWRTTHICQSVLKADSAAAERESESADRITDYNAALAQICAATAKCIFDHGQLHAEKFSAADVTTIDYFHPSIGGQHLLAATAWNVLQSFAASCQRQRAASC